MTTKERITKTLEQAYQPDSLEVIDESDRHKGHAGAREGGESHFRVRIVSNAFAGVPRLQIHRMINDVLAEELEGGVHALAIEARAPAAQ